MSLKRKIIGLAILSTAAFVGLKQCGPEIEPEPDHNPWARIVEPRPERPANNNTTPPPVMYPREGDNRPQRQPDAMDPYYPPDPVLSAAHVVHLERCFGLMAQTGLLPQHIERDVFRNALYGVHRAMVEEGQEIGPFLIESTCTAIVSNITAQSNFIHPERCRDMELKLRMTYNSTVRGEDQYMNFRYEICRPDQSRNIVPGDRGLRVVP